MQRHPPQGTHIDFQKIAQERDFGFPMLASKLEEEVACMTSAASSDVWYIYYRQWSLVAYDENQGVFLRISRREDELLDHHGEQGKVYSSREGYHSFSDRIERAVLCHKCVACARIGDELTFCVTTTRQGL